MRNKFLLLLLLLAGCATSPISSVVLQPDTPVSVPDLQPLSLYPVHWEVLTLDRLKQLVAQMEKTQQQAIIFSLDTTNYNNLSLNLIEIQRYIEEQKAILTMLKNIITERSSSSPAASLTSARQARVR